MASVHRSESNSTVEVVCITWKILCILKLSGLYIYIYNLSMKPLVLSLLEVFISCRNWKSLCLNIGFFFKKYIYIPNLILIIQIKEYLAVFKLYFEL